MSESINIDFVDQESIPEAHPARRFATLWDTFPKSGRFPNWKDFNPMSAPRILPWLILFEVSQRDGEEVHLVRVQGSSCVELMGVSFQGKYIQDVMAPAVLAERRYEFEQLREAGKSLFSRANIPVEGREFQTVIRGAFGFSLGGAEFARIVLIVAPELIKLPS